MSDKNMTDKAIIEKIVSDKNINNKEKLVEEIIKFDAECGKDMEMEAAKNVKDCINEATENGKDMKTDAAENTDKTQLFGKFKNPQELLRAYGELEKEFTKRSQKLSKLENELECESKKESELENGSRSEASYNAAYATDEEKWRAEVDKFFDENPKTRPFARQIALELIENPELREKNNCLAFALNQVLINEFRTPEQLMSDGEFLKKYVLNSDRIKDVIIEEYLADLESGKPPVTLTRGGTMAAACKCLPKNFDEAGKMFLKYNK